MSEDDRKWMELAVEEARKSKSEDDQPRPKVGVVVVGHNGELLTAAHRGEQEPGEHGEFTALHKKLPTAVLTGATVFATLDPARPEAVPKFRVPTVSSSDVLLAL